jgi:hypothetical protein
MPVVKRHGNKNGNLFKSAKDPKASGIRSTGCDRKPPMELPTMDPTTHTRPYIANAGKRENIDVNMDLRLCS